MSRSAWDRLFQALLNLSNDQFKMFTTKLINSRDLKPRVSRVAVEDKDRGDVARLLVDFFTEQRAVAVTVAVLRGLNYNQQANDLEQDRDEIDHPAPLPPPDEQMPSDNLPPEIPPNPDPNPTLPLINCTEQFKRKIIQEKGQEVYEVKVKSVRKRLALLINNVEFDCQNMKRYGSKRDEGYTEKLLTNLGYDVVKHNNLSGKEMDEALQNFASRTEHKDSDSTFVVIMSHGKRGAILGVHHGPKNPNDVLPVDRIYFHLNTENCPALCNKPKIILIQACRGDEKGRVWVSDSEHADPWNFQSDASWEHKEKDFGSLLSCTPDTVSYRHVENGALFIGFLVEVFNANAHKEHVEELFRMVMRRFENYPKLKQMVSKDRTSLPKLFYLFPGL